MHTAILWGQKLAQSGTQQRKGRVIPASSVHSDSALRSWKPLVTKAPCAPVLGGATGQEAAPGAGRDETPEKGWQPRAPQEHTSQV